MNIVISPFSSPFFNFFLNLTKYLEALNHQVVFLNPDPYLSSMLRAEGMKVEKYPKTKGCESFYQKSSPLVQQFCRLYQLKDADQVIQQKNKAFTQAKAYLQGKRPERVIIWNGEMNVETDACKELGVETFFCENGYFPNTFQANRRGVNAKSEYARLSQCDFMQFHFPQTNIPLVSLSILEVKQSLFKRYIYRFFSAEYRHIMWQALRNNRAKKIAKKSFENTAADTLDLESLTNWVFFPLQVNSDTQIVLNSPYRSMYEVLDCTLPKLLKAGYQVVLKEHPEEVEPVDYGKFVDNKQVFLLKKYDIVQLIAKSNFTITVNSSVGLQAVEASRPVVVLGESFYMSAPNVDGLDKESELITLVEHINPSEVQDYIHHFKNNIFIAGSWRNPTNEFLQKLCSRILAQ
ncbi:MAG: hypothetical protein ACK5L5_03965 [Bacteroidales bacterium]